MSILKQTGHKILIDKTYQFDDPNSPENIQKAKKEQQHLQDESDDDEGEEEESEEEEQI